MRILCDSRQTGIFTIAVYISEHRLDYCLFIIHRRVVAQIFQMIQKMQRKPIPIVIMVCAATLMMITNIFSLKLSISPIMLIIISAMLGIWGYAL